MCLFAKVLMGFTPKKTSKKTKKQHLKIAWHVTTWSVQFANKNTTPTWFVQNVKVTSNDSKNSPAASLLKEDKLPETVSFGFKKSYPSRIFSRLYTHPKTEIAPTNGGFSIGTSFSGGSMLVSGSVYPSISLNFRTTTKIISAKMASRKRLYTYLVDVAHSLPGTCLSSILRVEPSKTRPFPTKTMVIWVPGSRFCLENGLCIHQ